MSDCYSCSVDEAGTAAPDRERVWVTPRWRVAHATGSLLLGELLRTVSAALVTETGAVKTYAVPFTEAEGYSHLHVHLVPRAPELPEDLRGPRIFGYLGAPPDEEVPAAERDDFARRLRQALPAGGVPAA